VSRPIPPQLLKLCDEVRSVDDSLGQRSDHEGCDQGPTFQLWETCSKKHFARVCDFQIAEHRRAIRVWNQLRKLNDQSP